MEKKTIKWRHFILISAIACLGICSLQAQQLTPANNTALVNTKQGAVVEIPGFLTEKFPLIGYRKIVLPGPQYLISDDPEYIRVSEGIVMKEAVEPGTVRLYMYNVNGVKEPAKIDRKITALIKNTGKAKMHIRMLKYSSQKPSTNYYLIGKQGLADYFASTPQTSIRTVNPGEAIAIDEKFEKNIIKYDELAHGFYDFLIDQPGEVSILQTDPSTPGPKALKRIKKVEPSSHVNAGAGIFGVSNYRVIANDVLDTKNGTASLVVADGDTDKWVVGKDSRTGVVAELAGNYGVMYNIEMKWKSSDGKGLALVTWNSRSKNGQWCGGMANTMVVSKGKFDQGIIQLPSDRLITTGDPEAILIQVFPPNENGREQTIKLTYSPPGASCLPTPLVFIPVDIK